MRMDLRALFEHAADIVPMQEGETLFTEGAPGDTMYVILAGNVELPAKGRTLCTLSPGDAFGEMALIDNTHRSATAVATSKGMLAPVDERKFVALVQQTPYFALHIMHVLAERLRLMNERLAG